MNIAIAMQKQGSFRFSVKLVNQRRDQPASSKFEASGFGGRVVEPFSSEV